MPMQIDGNDIEKEANEAFKAGHMAEGHRLQDGFVMAFQEAYKNEDHCTCKKPCAYHGMCKECVAIHRGHEDHLPDCFKPMLKQKAKKFADQVEKSLTEEI